MDGTAQLLPGPTAGDGYDGGMNGDVASVHIGDRWRVGQMGEHKGTGFSVCISLTPVCACIYIYL